MHNENKMDVYKKYSVPRYFSSLKHQYFRKYGGWKYKGPGRRQSVNL